MTEPLTLCVAACALLLAIAIGILRRPRLPALDGERWFKTFLSTMLRGKVDGDGGTAETWERMVHRYTTYHPAARRPEEMVEDPAHYEFTEPELEGQRALVERLGRMKDVASRWAFLFVDEEHGVMTRLADPQELGDNYAPSTWLGPECTWERIADSAVSGKELARHLSRAGEPRWGVVGDEQAHPIHQRVKSNLLAELQDMAWEVKWSGETDPVETVVSDFASKTRAVSDRFVAVGIGRGAFLLLRALESDPGLRDRVLAIVAIGGDFMGQAEEGLFETSKVQAFMKESFNYQSMDTELARETTCFSLSWWDRVSEPPGLPNQPIAASRFPDPDHGLTPVKGLVRVDLGLLPADDDLPMELVVRALWATVGCWMRSRE